MSAQPNETGRGAPLKHYITSAKSTLSKCNDLRYIGKVFSKITQIVVRVMSPSTARDSIETNQGYGLHF